MVELSSFTTMAGLRLALFLFTTFLTLHTSLTLTFTQRTGTYAKFPRWNSCLNGSISFEFKTALDKALLLYTDDNGRSDYAEVMIIDGRVRLRMNVVDGKEGALEINAGKLVNDRAWHKVKVRRYRMETILYVDGEQNSRVAFGSDFQFGNIESNNNVYIGGLPQTYFQGKTDHLKSLSLPSSFFEPRFEGDIRNVIYENCTCYPERAAMIEGLAVSREPREACDVTNDCGKCLCVSGNEGSACQCHHQTCPKDSDIHYQLPFDRMSEGQLVNPSGLDARVTGRPRLVPGVQGNALKVDCSSESVKVTGPGHRQECMGDLSLCPSGYTIGLWFRFEEVAPGQNVYLSNGGEQLDSHGIAMLYENGRLEWVFRLRTGREWRAAVTNVLAHKWYHVAATWSDKSGLTLYVNGEKEAQEKFYSVRAPISSSQSRDDFVICQSNNGTGSRALLTVDELQFWAKELSISAIKEMGPIYSLHISMDQIQDGQLIMRNIEPKTRGRLRQVPGKIGMAANIAGLGEYIDFGNFTDSCIGNVTKCSFGFTVAFWINFKDLYDNMYVMASGVSGFSIFIYSKRLYANVQDGDRQWQTSVSNIQTGSWYFIEVTWEPISGLQIYMDRKLMASQKESSHEEVTSSNRNYDNLYLGRANTVMYSERYLSATVDDVHVFNADRQRLLNIDYILRVKPEEQFYGFELINNGLIENRNSLVPIQTRGNVTLVPGQVGRALLLAGDGQSVEFDHGDGCLGNMDFCRHGAMIAIWINFEKLEDRMVYLSSAINGFEITFTNKKLRATVQTSTRMWEVMTPSIHAFTWYFLELSLDPEAGLKMYLNNRLMEQNLYPIEKRNFTTVSQLGFDEFLLAASNTDRTGSKAGAAIFDEMDFWEASRDYLTAFGYIQRGKPMSYKIHMDEIVDNGRRLAHESLIINLSGFPLLVPGVKNSGLQLDGNSQYVDVGKHGDKCLGNLDQCPFGISIFFWLKVAEYYDNMYILSTGQDGIQIFCDQGYIYVILNNKQNSWRIGVEEVTKDQWHFFELTWHPEHGMDLFIDGNMTHADSRAIRELTWTDDSNFYIGRPNPFDVAGRGFRYARVSLDELEVWYAWRGYLVAWGHVLRGHVGYESFSMETASDDVIFHPRYRVTLERGASLVAGAVGNAVSLRGTGEYVDLGNHMDECFANIDLCQHGLTISLMLKPESLKANQYFLAGPTYSLYLENGHLKAEFYSSGKVWNVTSQAFNFKNWNDVVLSWDKEDGLEMYLDDKLAGRNKRPGDMRLSDARQTGSLYLGRSAETGVQGTAEMMADEVQFWYANLDNLRLRRLYQGAIHTTIPLDKMPPNGVLSLPGRRVEMKGGASLVKGQKSQAIRLAGKPQYVTLGEDLVCGGDLTSCRHGFNVRLSVRPGRLADNMYFLDSYPLTVFYSDGRLYATVRAGRNTWTAGYPGFKSDTWQTVDISWHPEIGLTLLIDGKEPGAHKTHPTEIEPVYDYDRETYFGRAMTNMRNERYADVTLETIDVWNVRRDVLLSNNTLHFGLPGISSGSAQPGRPTLRPTEQGTAQPPSSDDARTRDNSGAVTVAPTNGQDSLGSRLVKTTSKIIRFFGDSFIKYSFDGLPSEVFEEMDTESVSLKFITQSTDGLIWFWNDRAGNKMHISLKAGSLYFVNDDVRGTPQQVRVQHPDSRVVNDFRWHTVRVEKNGREMKIFLDEQLAQTVTAPRDIQFIPRGADVYLGGTASPWNDTRGLVNTKFDGALVDVESKKSRGPNKEIIISFLQQVGQATGNITIIDTDDWNSGRWTWGTTPAPPTIAPRRPTPVTFKTGNSMFFLSDALDMRSGGTVSYRFRTLEPSGLLSIARGSGVQFFAMEVYDGILYFVYDFGSLTARNMFTDRRVDDGEWHEVTMRVDAGSRRMTLTLDGRPFTVPLSNDQLRSLYFFKMYFGGYDNYLNAPWPLYARKGYKGCLESLRINDIGYDLHLFIRNQRLSGVETGCASMLRQCQALPCDAGFCRDRMSGYVCDCANTPYTGRNCNENAAIARWDGSFSTAFNFVNRDVTHTNDLSVRFNTPLKDTLLFRTEADSKGDYIQAELDDGRLKITFRVDGQTKTFVTGSNLNDYNWHTMYIRRRADDVQVWVDDEPRTVGVIGGENYNLYIDRIKFGSIGETGELRGGNYIGYMQNFVYDGQELFGQLKGQSSSVKWIFDLPFESLPLLTYKPITVTSDGAFFQLPSMTVGRTLKIMFKFKTRESNGLILYNSGIGSDVIAIELSDGQIRLAYNLGAGIMHTVVPTRKLNDNAWHDVQVALNDRGQFTVRVDGETVQVSNSDRNTLSLSGMLYIGGMPTAMFSRPEVTALLDSRKGFRGCMASVDLNGAVPDLVSYASDKTKVLNGCTDLTVQCQPNACGPGVCVPRVNDFWCDCNMTGLVGIPCITNPNGYYFGKNGGRGIVVYEYPLEKQVNSNSDMLAFGFKTLEKDGVLYRIESSLDNNEYIEIRLENGHVIAESNTGSGLVRLVENSRVFNDGQYHVVRYIRTGSNSTLQVDQLPTQLAVNTGVVSLFNSVYRVMLGGRIDSKGAINQNFYGIIGGAYYNGHRWLDLLLSNTALHGKLVNIRGDVVLTKTYLLVAGGGKTTPAPPDLIINPTEQIPVNVGGGGVIGPGVGGGGGGGSVGVPSFGGAGPYLSPLGSGINVGASPNAGRVVSALAGGPIMPGARAGAVVGTVLGTMAFLTSLMWALYKLKPGVPTCLSPGAGAAGSGAGMSISSPRPASNLGAVQAASAGAGGAGGGAGGAGAGATKMTVVNGSAAGGGGGAGGGNSTYTSYFQSSSTAVSGGGAGGGGAGGADVIDSSTLRATGTFSNRGTAIGSPTADRRMGSSSYSSNANYQSNTMQSYGSGGGTMDRGYTGQYLSQSAGGGDGIPDYDMPVGGTMQSGQSYSSSTLNTNYNYQVTSSANSRRNVKVVSSAPQNYTSVLNVIMTSGRHGNIEAPRCDLYTAAFAPGRNQGFVDRAEDMVVEQTPPILIVRPMVGSVTNAGSESSSGVTLHTSGDPHASYSNRGYQTMPGRGELIGIGENRNTSNRKSSLQVPAAGSSKAGYQRLENSSSETNVNTFKSETSRTATTTHIDHSRDDLFESTTTIISNVRSDSMDTGLFDGSSNSQSEGLMLDLSFDDIMKDVQSGHFGGGREETSIDNLYAKVNKNSKSQKSVESSQSFEMDDFTSSTMSKSSGGYAVTCTAQLKDENKSNQQFDSSASSKSSQKQVLSGVDGNIVGDFVVVDYGNENNRSGRSSPFIGQQTDRSENIIVHQPETFTRKTSVPSGNSGLTQSSSQSSTVHVLDETTGQSSTHGSSTINIIVTGDKSGSGVSMTGSGRDLDAELNASVHNLLTGINVDAGRWEDAQSLTSVGSTGSDDTDVYQVQNLKTVVMNKQGQYVMSSASGGFGAGAVTPGAAADEVRVDCCLMTGDGRSVVTGSSLGPPQVWDMQTGELQNIMKGDTIGSTNLHLVCGDRLLVGAVHADMEINEYSSRKGVFNHTLQIWDFQTGRPLAMAVGEYCSALCPMSDSDKVLFGRTDKFGDATSIIAWDLMGNQMIKEMRYDAPVGNNDYISFLTKSKNDRYIIAGFTNSFDNNAEFMTFDMTLTSYNVNEPAMLKLDANPEVTAILPKDEAVTGLRNGDLVVWSLRTAQPSRQLLGSGGAHAHTREVKSVTLSDDGRYLVSGSADGTLKVWDMNTERPIHTLQGHTDEVWCTAISSDNEIAVSGSADGTIRLWRVKNGTEMCVFNCGVDIFDVTMSRDKGTIVALGDKYGARKLIMLQVVRTKIKKIVSS
ncbi:uncharacterized protein LOC128241470 isoform X5 [Mya arenaria]|uniref:uncharacterized protein LOC128241470 isoform X5 n=1 Tax=Mya arenaria TaxID=6604 RepID=UPI0022E8A22D|nr:uncharacterized protein LOC128241470 isoform X5 [Mya arenaria]